MTLTASSVERIVRPEALRTRLQEARARGERIGFVPTMGALHEGHLSLIDMARKRSDLVVMSIFVNPLQFGPGEDFSRYPRDVEADSALVADRGVDILFVPTTETMYGAPPRVTVEAGEIGSQWEGKVRPGHFSGMLTVVTKLFHLVAPDVAVFGQKDLQQSALVRALIEDLNFPIELVVAPIVREADGLAMSSRNRFLSAGDRASALGLRAALVEASKMFDSGTSDPRALERAGRAALTRAGVTDVDYFAIIDQSQFASLERAAAGNAIIVAARIGATRLIDNVVLGS